MFHLKNLSAGYLSNYFSIVAVEEERAARAARGSYTATQNMYGAQIGTQGK
jgi:hypothetical protein